LKSAGSIRSDKLKNYKTDYLQEIITLNDEMFYKFMALTIYQKPFL